MKRYLLFRGLRYYPEGGFEDFDGSFDTVEEAISARYAVMYDQINDLNSMEDALYDGFYLDWAHIADLVTGEIVWTQYYYGG